MKIDLNQQKELNGILTPVILKAIQTTKAQASDLYRLYAEMLRVWKTSIAATILPAYRKALARAKSQLRKDDDEDPMLALEVAETGWLAYLFGFKSKLTAWVNSFARWHTIRLRIIVKQGTRVDLSNQITQYDPEIANTITQVVNSNVSLVRSVSDQLRERLAQILINGMKTQASVGDISKQINKVLGLAKDRSERIAIDQTTKLSRGLDQARQLQLGIVAFKWRHSGKLHYRPWHKARDGKTFFWNGTVGRTDPPGLAPFCGCEALGIVGKEEDGKVRNQRRQETSR